MTIAYPKLVVAVALFFVVLMVGFAFPTSVVNPALGAEWQCHRTVGLLTTCQHVGGPASMPQPAIDRVKRVVRV